MPEISLRIPMIGEGLQEARLVAVLKQPGDRVERDEAIYQMETDKAVMDVESPHAGTVVKWLAEVDTILPIGAEVMVMNTEGASDAPAEAAPAAAPQPEATGGDNIVPIKIPMIGEGLQEARLVAFLKQPGDMIKRDEPIYQMETDKAVMDVEAPFAGRLVAWLAEVDTVMPIGAEVATIEVEGGTPASSAAQTSSAPAASQPVAARSQSVTTEGSRRRDIPPRTRAYAKSKGVTEEALNSISASGSKLMPEDIDKFLAGGGAPAPQAAASGASSSGKTFSEVAMSGKQRVLSSRLVRGNQITVPGMMAVVVNWEPIERAREKIKASGSDFQPSTFTIFAYAVAKAAVDHPIMRSTIVGESNVRTYDHLQLGIAVSLQDDLVVAVVEDASKLSWREFAEQARAKIDLARTGKDQANESVTLSITNMQAAGIRDAMAVVVPPGVATIFLGEPFNGLAQDTTELKLQRSASVGITIDHRLINGVPGAAFLQAVKQNVETIDSLLE